MDVPETMHASRLVARGLTKRFFRKGRESARYFDAVSSCDMELVPGEIVVLMGRSGSGKSTLLNMLAGLLEPSEGAVELDGTNIYELSDSALSELRNASFGVIPQGQTALHSLSVVENVMLPLEMYRAGDGGEAKALSLLGEMGISDLSESYPGELSGGELRRMAIARSLICDPSFVFADEPTSDLDDENTETVLDILRGVADKGAAVLIVTHEQSATRVADKVYRMNAGKIEAAAVTTVE